MPVHDWSRIDAGTFHAFHTAWVTHLSEMMNDGLLPAGYYTMPEQHLGRSIGDVLTLHAAPPAQRPPLPDGGLALAEAPPKVGRKLTVSGSARTRRRTLTVRHVSGHRIVALVEIVSPANKDRPSHVDDLASKVTGALALGVHVLVADLLAPGPHDPGGIHGAIWEQLDPEAEVFVPPPTAPLTLASYVARAEVDAYLESIAVGDGLPEMPLFLHPDRYVKVPLETAYEAAFRGMPAYWREVLENPGG
jgi:hypothetical protein